MSCTQNLRELPDRGGPDVSSAIKRLQLHDGGLSVQPNALMLSRYAQARLMLAGRYGSAITGSVPSVKLILLFIWTRNTDVRGEQVICGRPIILFRYAKGVESVRSRTIRLSVPHVIKP